MTFKGKPFTFATGIHHSTPIDENGQWFKLNGKLFAPEIWHVDGDLWQFERFKPADNDYGCVTMGSEMGTLAEMQRLFAEDMGRFK